MKNKNFAVLTNSSPVRQTSGRVILQFNELVPNNDPNTRHFRVQT